MLNNYVNVKIFTKKLDLAHEKLVNILGGHHVETRGTSILGEVRNVAI